MSLTNLVFEVYNDFFQHLMQGIVNYIYQGSLEQNKTRENDEN